MVDSIEALLTVRDAAKALNLCERKIWSLVAGGELPTVRIGRAVRFDPADLRQWIEAHKIHR
ncbi:MAG: helix-turn-helix domain-containing protein [Pirellulales bacterium]